MSDQIAVGDIVWAVRDCCGRYIGRPFRVKSIDPTNGESYCDHCKKYGNGPFAENADDTPWDIGHLPLSWLRKLQPPPLESTAEREAEVSA